MRVEERGAGPPTDGLTGAAAAATVAADCALGVGGEGGLAFITLVLHTGQTPF